MQIQNNMIGNIDTLINRNSKDQPMLINNSPIKYSAIILDYLSPFLDIKDSESTTKEKITVGIYLWNLAVEQQLDMVDEEKNNSFKELLTQIEMGLELYDDLLTYKLENFSEHEFIVSDFIIGSANSKIYGAFHSFIIGGHTNIINHAATHSTIIGCIGLTSKTPNTVIVPQLRIASVTEATALTPYSLFVNSSGYVYRKNINGTNGISINNGLSSITISYTGATIIGINNGLNIYTGGTSSNPTINISGATLSYLSAGTLSGGTILSGGTDIGNIFVVSGATSGNGYSIFINKINNNLLFKKRKY